MQQAFIILTFAICTILFQNESRRYWVDDFEDETSFSTWKGKAKNHEDIYGIAKEEQNKFLKAISKSSDNFIIKEVDIDIVEYPYLNWSWRANLLPKNGNEHHKKTCDIAASVYLIVRPSKWRPQSIKYTWSTTLDIDVEGTSPFAFWPARSDFIVKETGTKNLNKWTQEKVNVLEDYKRLYDKDELHEFKIKAIAIMTDSDNTNSASAADYDNIFFSKD